MNKASRLALLLEMIMTEATTIKDTDAVAFKLKLYFNSLFKEARRYSREYDKACIKANVSEIAENATSDLYDCFDIIMSTDIKKCKELLEKFRDEKTVVGWITQDYYGSLLRHKTKPRKVGLVWMSDNDTCTITYEEAFALCGSTPAWTDTEPICIYE